MTNRLVRTRSIFRELSMRAASIGPVKKALIEIDLDEVRAAIEKARRDGMPNAGPLVAPLLEPVAAE